MKEFINDMEDASGKLLSHFQILLDGMEDLWVLIYTNIDYRK